MKTTGRNKGAVFAIGMALLTPAVFAQPNNGDEEKTLKQNSEERYVLLTGSHVPQKVKVRSIGTDTPYNVRIYTQRELQSTGRSTPAEALSALDPSITISRH